MSRLRSSVPSCWPAALAGGAAALGLLFYYRSLWESLAGFSAAIDHCPDLFCDFVRHFYPTGRSILQGGNPVEGYFYSILFAFFLTAFTWVPLSDALWLWGGFQLIVIGFLFLASVRGGRLRDPSRAALYVVVFFASVPILHTFKWGQVSALLVLCELFALRLYDQSRRLCAAVVLGSAIAIKFYPVVLLLYFLFRRDVRFVAICSCTAGVLLVLPVGWLGLERGIEIQRAVSGALLAANGTWIQHDPNSQFLPHVVRRVVGFGSGQGWMLARTLAAAACAGSLLLVWAALRRGDPRSDRVGRVLLFVSTPFWVPTSWPHYFCYLPAAQFLLLDGLTAESVWPERSRRAAVLLVGLSMALSSVFALQAWGGWYRYSSSGALLFADLSLVVACCLYLRFEQRDAKTPVPS